MSFGPLSTDSIRVSDETARILLQELLGDPGRLRLSDEQTDPSAGGDPSPSHPLQGSLAAGRYRIVRRLAQGGMGVVYEAEQENPRRPVALKIVRAECVTDELLRRFAQEAQALARLHHPNIAQIYDAGTIDTPTGSQPFLAMEMIEGEPIVRYAQERVLPITDRLALFMKLCDAVEHMHGANIVHRDLKPDNILVDALAEPKLIDFGVALLADRQAGATTHTAAGQLLGTMSYMSPEQASGGPAGVDHRSDVYSLGMILYELLAGRPPYKVDRHMLHESLRTIREDEPAPLGATDRALAGDLEAIVAKALEKEKERRYQSAADLAADLRRYAEHRPVQARQPSALYRARKFTRRRRALVAGCCAVVATLLLGMAATTWQALEATRARRIAEERQAEAEKQSARAATIADFLKRMLTSPDPSVDGRFVRVVDALAKAERDAADAFEGHADLEADVRETLGSVYYGLGLYPEARAQFGRCLELLRQLRDEGDPVVLNAMHNLATAMADLDDFSEGEAMLRRAIEGFKHSLGPDDPTTLRSMSVLGIMLLQRQNIDEAGDVVRETLDAQRRSLGVDHADTLNTLNSWAGVLTLQDKLEEAEASRRELLARSTERFGDEHPQTLAAGYNLARLLQRRGANPEAAQSLEDLVPKHRRVMGELHPLTLSVERSCAYAIGMAGRTAEAESAFAATLVLHEQVLGALHPDTIAVKVRLALACRDQGKLEEAVSIAADASQRASSMQPMDAVLAGDVHLNYGKLLLAADRPEDAATPLKQAHSILQAKLGDDHARTRDASNMLKKLEGRPME